MLSRLLLFVVLLNSAGCAGIVTKRGQEFSQSHSVAQLQNKPETVAVPTADPQPATAIQVEDLPPIPVTAPEVVLEKQEIQSKVPAGQEFEQAQKEVQEDVRQANAREGDQVEVRESVEVATSSQPQIPVELNEKVEKWIQYFTVTDKERFQRFLNRGRHYREVVENVLQENDLPPQLYYLAMIESGYRTEARSKAKAVGVWQFIAGTATRYGLRVDRFVDERQDPIRATEAAAKYLRDLYNVFGSWHLAMAAYNAGEIRILRAVFKGRTRDFWELVDAKVLPKETAEYVPKFLAVVKIGEDPSKYGFHEDDPVESYPELEAVPIQSSVPLKKIADQFSISYEVLRKVNPQLIQGRLPPKGYEIWVPQDLVAKVNQPVEWSHSEEKKIQKKVRVLASSADVGKSHVVRSGENLAQIASKYKITVGHLMRINGLKSSKILVGSRLRTQARVYSAGNVIRYRVRKGDNLSEIARKFRTSVGQIKRANNLFGSKVIAGQTLKIRTAEKSDGT